MATRRPLLLILFTLAAAGGCARSLKPLPLGEVERPQRVMVVTIAREQAPPVTVRPGLSLGVMLGSLGTGVSGGIGMDVGRDAARQRPSVEFGDLDFRQAVQSIYLASAPAPGEWIWVDGDAAEGPVLDEIVALAKKKSAPAPLAVAWAGEHRIDKILVIEPVVWGFQRGEGFVVELEGRMYEARGTPQRVWTGSSGRRKPPNARPDDVSEPRRRLLEAAAEAARALVSAFSGRAR